MAKTDQVIVRIPAQLKLKLRREAKQLSIGLSELIRLKLENVKVLDLQRFVRYGDGSTIPIEGMRRKGRATKVKGLTEP